MSSRFDKVITAFIMASVAACAHTDIYTNPDIRAEGPKIVALDARRLPWVAEIEKGLRREGFQVLRWESQHSTLHEVDKQRTHIFDEAATNYILRVDGAAYLDPMNRCFGGGFKFDYISVELIDVRSNQVLASYSGGGYSENCPPLSGTIFRDIVNLVVSAWQ